MANPKHAVQNAANDAWMIAKAHAWWSAMSEYNGEMFDFLSHRFAKDSRALRDLGECHGWSEVSNLHGKWLQEAFKDYSNEATRLTAIYAKSADMMQERPAH